MGKNSGFDRRQAERAAFEERRTIDVTDAQAMRFWSQRLGVSEAEIIEVIRQVGPNSTAVALKLEAPQGDRVPPPITPP